MKSVSQVLLGISATLSVPSTVEEFNSFVKGTSTVLDYANDEAYYRGIAPKVRTEFLKSIKEQFKFEPNVLSEKTVGEGEKAKVVKTYEKDTAFLKRIIAGGLTKETLQPVLQAAFDKVGWDLSSSRSSGPNKKDTDAADYYIQAVANGETTWDRLVGNFEAANSGLQIQREEDGSVSKEIFAEACKINRLRLENEAKGGLL